MLTISEIQISWVGRSTKINAISLVKLIKNSSIKYLTFCNSQQRLLFVFFTQLLEWYEWYDVTTVTLGHNFTPTESNLCNSTQFCEVNLFHWFHTCGNVARSKDVIQLIFFSSCNLERLQLPSGSCLCLLKSQIKSNFPIWELHKEKLTASVWNLTFLV